ncbi:MAG: insulinase family protein [Desulfobacterales bacterium]|nr:insulinase family protein [Desulfobacterales bacterium]
MEEHHRCGSSNSAWFFWLRHLSAPGVERVGNRRQTAAGRQGVHAQERDAFPGGGAAGDPQVAVRLAIRAGSALGGARQNRDRPHARAHDVQGHQELRVDRLPQGCGAPGPHRCGLRRWSRPSRPSAAPTRRSFSEKLAEMEQLRLEAQKLYIPQVFSSQLGKNGAVGVNAFTSQDQTQYIASVPSDMIEQWFSIISEQLFEPSWREFYVEKEVVQREWAFRYVNNPEGAAWLDLNANGLHRASLPQPRHRLEVRHGALQHPGCDRIPLEVLQPRQRRLRPGGRRHAGRSPAAGRDLLRALPGRAAGPRDGHGGAAPAGAAQERALPRGRAHPGRAHRLPRGAHQHPRLLRPGCAHHGPEPGAQRPADPEHRRAGAGGRGLGGEPRPRATAGMLVLGGSPNEPDGAETAGRRRRRKAGRLSGGLRGPGEGCCWPSWKSSRRSWSPRRNSSA